MPINLIQIPIADGFIIIYITDVPCHLWMRWTLVLPQKHLIPVTKRGVAIRKDIRQCFVAYKDNEQGEPGDTLLHTFTKTNWPICQTRYFCFWGKTAGGNVKSTSPIFTKHRKAVLIMELIYLEPWSEGGGLPPDMVLIYLEPWSEEAAYPPTFAQIFYEPWSS